MRYNKHSIQAKIQRVRTTGQSEPPIWRLGPPTPINVGARCWCVVVGNWPEFVAKKGSILGYNGASRIYCVKFDLSRTIEYIAASRVFSGKFDAEREAKIHNKSLDTFIWFQTSMLDLPLKQRVRDNRWRSL